MQLAQINVATILYDTEDPRMAEFMDNLDRINALAEESPGFVWRLQDDSGNATDIHAFDDPHLLLNMSVWSDIESLKNYVYKTQHTEFLAKRKNWFEMPAVPHLALWWIEDGDFPSAAEGRRRLEHLQTHGPGPVAFTFKHIYPRP